MNFTLLKITTVALWLLVIVNLFADFPTWIYLGLNLLGLFCLFAHLAEYLLLGEIIDRQGDGKIKAFFMTLVFGFVYWKRPVPEDGKEAG